MIKTVVVIDDSPISQEVTEIFFKRYNPDGKFHAYYTVSEALTAIAKMTDPIDVIFLDFYLSATDGYGPSHIDAISQLKPRVPIVMLTGSESYQDIFEAYKKKSTLYIVKPLTVKNLIQLASDLKLKREIVKSEP